MLQRGPGGHPDRCPEFGGDDRRERGLAEPGRTTEQNMIGNAFTSLSGFEHQPQLILDTVLSDELTEGSGAQSTINE